MHQAGCCIFIVSDYTRCLHVYVTLLSEMHCMQMQLERRPSSQRGSR